MPYPRNYDAAVVVLLLALLLPPLGGCGGGSSPERNERPAVERFADEGREHIDPSEMPTYRTAPPTSGPHYPEPTLPGFYREETPRPGNLVHALEHGNIVIYYDPVRVSAADQERIRALCEQYFGLFDGVIAVPRTDPDYPVILTAWRARLRLPSYDTEHVAAFLDEFRGRGPERPER